MTPFLISENPETESWVWGEIDGIVFRPHTFGHLDVYVAGYRDVDRRVHERFPGLLCYARRRLPGDYGPLEDEIPCPYLVVVFGSDTCLQFAGDLPTENSVTSLFN